MKKILIATFSLGLVCSLSCVASASIISEMEPNNPLGSAQNIDAYFSTDFNADVQNSTSTPWVSILGTGDGTYDYYSFTVEAGATAWFDIDYGRDSGGSMDTEIALWDSSGNYLAENDDGGAWNGGSFDAGTIHGYDSYMEFASFATSGTYIIGVAEFPSGGLTGGWGGNLPDQGDTYTLQVSIEGHPTAAAPVPEPATMLLFGTGLSCLAAMGRRRKKS